MGGACAPFVNLYDFENHFRNNQFTCMHKKIYQACM